MLRNIFMREVIGLANALRLLAPDGFLCGRKPGQERCRKTIRAFGQAFLTR